LARPQCPRLRKSRIAGAHACGEFGKIGVVAKARLFLKLAEPLGVALRRFGRLGAAHAEALQIHQLRHAFRAHARIHVRDIAAHAVADQHDRPLRLEVCEQAVQIAHVIREPVAVGWSPSGEAVAAPIRRDDLPIAAQRVDEELERG
jgi:hypothetical protein